MTEQPGKFAGLAEAYAAGRPAYADAMIDDLYERCGFSADCAAVDIGSGTGKFARQLLVRGSRVACVEPDDEMREKLRMAVESFPRASVHNGTAEHTGMPSHSFDFVTAAQAFHWFDPAAFSAECRRILRPGGRVLLIWNRRDANAAVNRAWAAINRSYCPEFTGFSGGMAEDDPRIASFFNGNYTETSYDFPLQYGLDRFLQRALSSSYAPRVGDAAYEGFVSEMRDLFNEYADDGVLFVPNRTVLYMGDVCEG